MALDTYDTTSHGHYTSAVTGRTFHVRAGFGFLPQVWRVTIGFQVNPPDIFFRAGGRAGGQNTYLNIN